MSRSDHHGCRPNCGMCHPEKKWKNQLSRFARLRITDKRKLQDEKRRGGKTGW